MHIFVIKFKAKTVALFNNRLYLINRQVLFTSAVMNSVSPNYANAGVQSTMYNEGLQKKINTCFKKNKFKIIVCTFVSFYKESVIIFQTF